VNRRAVDILEQMLSKNMHYLRRFWPTTEPIFRYGILVLLGIILYRELVPIFGTSADVLLYRRAGTAILAGQVPYQDFLIEYPPGALPTFVLPRLFSRGAGYATFFAAEMATLLVATMFITVAASRRFGKPWLLPPWWLAPGYCCSLVSLTLDMMRS
jgi:hypothetical protein